MAITVGFVRAIGVITDETFTPDIYGTLEEKLVLKGQLEKDFSIISWLEEKFNMKGKAKK